MYGILVYIYEIIPSLITKTVSIKAISAPAGRKLKDVLGGKDV